MKKLGLIFFITFSSITFSQNEIPDDFIFSQIVNEVNISGNISTISNTNTTNKFGGGLGIYHVFLEPSFFNILLGFEYNFTSQYLKYYGEGHTTYRNAIHQLHNFTIPLILRFNVGRKNKVVFELGPYMENTIFNGLGDVHYWSYTYSSISENQKFHIGNGVSGGVLASIGMKIPLKENLKMILRMTYHYGLGYYYQNKTIGNYFPNQYLKLSIGLNWARKYNPTLEKH